MIKVQVFLQNDYDRMYEDIKITKDELIQYACDKAKERYERGHWTRVTADEVEVQGNIA